MNTSLPWQRICMAAFEGEFPILRSRRLILREFRESAFKHLYTLRNDPKVSRFIHRVPKASPAEIRDLLANVKQLFKEKKGFAWAGVLAGSGEFIGSLGLREIDFEQGKAEIGGELDSSYWGRGLPGEALEAVLRFAFDQLWVPQVWARLDKRNRSAVYWLTRNGFDMIREEAIEVVDDKVSLGYFSLQNPRLNSLQKPS